MTKNFLLSLICVLSSIAYAQVTEVPEPCDTGTENTCTCEDAPILCTIDALDEYGYEMTTFLHPDDGPDPMCSGPEGNNTTSHNPTWFGFLAWCEELTIEVQYINCINNPNSCNALGIQVAVYEDCSLDPNSAISCDTDVGGCVNNSSRTVNITGMTIGSTYYFLVDGCCGSACTIRINVVGSCGQNEIPEFTDDEEIQGPEILCNPSGLVNYYLEEEHLGSVNYQWTVTPTGGSTTEIDYGEDLLGVDYEFPNPGEYEICVDVDNEPCITLDDAPDPNCKIVLVLDEVADAGDLTADPVCPNDELFFSTANYTDSPDFDQWVIVTDASGEILFTQQGDNGSYTYDMCGTLSFYSYNFYNNADPTYTIPVVGDNINDFEECLACFCDLQNIDLIWEDTELPLFDNPPNDIVVDCYDEVSVIPDLSLQTTVWKTGLFQVLMMEIVITVMEDSILGHGL